MLSKPMHGHFGFPRLNGTSTADGSTASFERFPGLGPTAGGGGGGTAGASPTGMPGMAKQKEQGPVQPQQVAAAAATERHALRPYLLAELQRGGVYGLSCGMRHGGVPPFQGVCHGDR
mmetsp:Transcript_36013/g.84440  ORF Transcript_36013/g.84440 Transcript_36013/m.84440 type:complete len:118 (+) Transcript_36013:956-1309(+)